MTEWFLVLFLLTGNGVEIEQIPMQNKEACEIAGSQLLAGELSNWSRLDAVWCINTKTGQTSSAAR